MTPDALDLDAAPYVSAPTRENGRAPSDLATPEQVFAAELAKWRGLLPQDDISPALMAGFVLAAAHGARAALNLLARDQAQILWSQTPAWVQDLAFRPDDASLLQALTALDLDFPQSVTTAFRHFADIRPLAAPVEALLLIDGDERARLNPETGLNRYGCRAVATHDALALSACSANEPSDRGLAAADSAREALMRSLLSNTMSQALTTLAARCQARILQWLGVRPHTAATVILTDSGTNATQLAAIAAHSGPNPSVAIVVGPLETGREIPEAAAHGPSFVKLETIPVRDPATGQAYDSATLADLIALRVKAAHAKGQDVVLHVLEGSKTGLAAPGIDGVRTLMAEFPAGLKIIADFCQMRPHSDAQPYLAMGAAIVTTGSKFMGGPAFSGAAILPPDWRGSAPIETVIRPGTALRWEAALAEGESYWRLDPLRRASGLTRFIQSVREASADFPEVDVLDDAQATHIVALRVKDIETDGWMSQKQLERLNRWLAQDAQPLLPVRAKSFEIRLAQQRCLLGQALTVGLAGALRIAANAHRIAQLADNANAAAQLHQDISILLSKIALIRRYWPKSH